VLRFGQSNNEVLIAALFKFGVKPCDVFIKLHAVKHEVSLVEEKVLVGHLHRDLSANQHHICAESFLVLAHDVDLLVVWALLTKEVASFTFLHHTKCAANLLAVFYRTVVASVIKFIPWVFAFLLLGSNFCLIVEVVSLISSVAIDVVSHCW